MAEAIRVLIVDDHEIVREGLRTLLSEAAGIEVVGEAANGLEAVEMALACQPDVILLDLIMPGMDGIEVTHRLRELKLSSRILILTSFGEDQRVREAIRAGATGYLLKDILKPELLHAIQQVARGLPALHPEAQRALMRQMTEPSPFEGLTEREQDVLRLIAEGRSNREIARTLHLTEGTVKGYVSTILSKLGVSDRTQAALLAVRQGIGGERTPDQS